MEKTEDLSHTEGANPDDHDLSEELESLYRRVARFDQPDASVEKGDTHDDDQDFKPPRPRRTAPYQNPPNREELMEKLMAIQDAYERLLTYWPFAQERLPRSPLGEASPEMSIRNAPPESK
jgi:hypothetical protein